MILRKNIDGEDILGLKIVGGRRLCSGNIGAIVEKVKRGSIADQEGHIKPGNCFLKFIFKTSRCIHFDHLYPFLPACVYKTEPTGTFWPWFPINIDSPR